MAVELVPWPSRMAGDILLILQHEGPPVINVGPGWTRDHEGTYAWMYCTMVEMMPVLGEGNLLVVLREYGVTDESTSLSLRLSRFGDVRDLLDRGGVRLPTGGVRDS